MRAILACVVVLSTAAGCMTASLSPSGLDGVLDPAAPGAFAPVVDLLAATRAAAASGGTVTVQAHLVQDGLAFFGALNPPVPMEVVLERSTIVDEATWAEVDGARVPMPFVEVYEGHVVDREDWPVRITFTEEWARGTIVTTGGPAGAAPAYAYQYLVRDGLRGNLPYDVGPLNETSKGPVMDRESGGVLVDPAGWSQEQCLALVPPYVTPMTDLGMSGADALVADVVLDGDSQYMENLGRHAFPMMIAMLAEADAVYHHEVGVRFRVAGVHMHSDPEAFPDPEEQAPLYRLAEYWTPRADVDRDLVHLFTGQPSAYAQANCIGGAGVPEVAFTFTPVGWDAISTNFHVMAIAHEIGHIFSAHHHYGNPIETGARGATIMIQGYTPGVRPVFGTIEKGVIRGWAEEHLD